MLSFINKDWNYVILKIKMMMGIVQITLLIMPIVQPMLQMEMKQTGMVQMQMEQMVMEQKGMELKTVQIQTKS